MLAPFLLGGLGGVGQDALAFGDRIDAGGELALDLHGDAAGLIGGEALAIGADGVAADATGSSGRIAVLDEEDLVAGGRDLDAEAWQLGVEDNLILVSGFERINSTLGEFDAGRRGD